jgi:hypothetical protein
VNSQLPEILYRVVRTRSNAIDPYSAASGGTYADLKHARRRVENIRAKGGDARIHYCCPEWHELDPSVEILTVEQLRARRDAVLTMVGMGEDNLRNLVVNYWASDWQVLQAEELDRIDYLLGVGV